MRHRLHWTLLVGLFHTLVVLAELPAEYLPPAGGEDILQTSNGLQDGESVIPRDQPSARLANPSILPEVEVPVLDIGYLGFFDLALAADPVWGGHVLAGNVVLPVSAGSLGIGLHFSTLNNTGLSSGTNVLLNGSWARQLPGGFALGVGVQGGIGGSANVVDWALSADLGVSQRIENISGLSALSWGVSVTGLGKGLAPVEGRTSLVSPFTLRAGIGFEIGNPETLLFRPGLDISAPGFQNLRVGLQAAVRLFRIVELGFRSTIDIRQLSQDDISQKSIIPSVSLSILLPNDGPKIGSSAGAWYGDIWAFGIHGRVEIGDRDRTGPEIQVDSGEIQNISPNNDGVQDREDLSVSIHDPSGLSRIEFAVLNSSGELVFSEEREAPIQEIANISSFFDYLFKAPQRLVPSHSIAITGKDNEGQVLEDGTYRVRIVGFDGRGNSALIESNTFVIDNTPPSLEISQPSPEERIFSPNGDGNKDSIVLRISGSVEPTWEGGIFDVADNLVRTVSFDGNAPRDYEWDGTNNSGERVSDGVYEFRIAGTDGAGNKIEGELTNIILNAFVSPVRLQIGDRAFSPNRDGVKDFLQFSPELSRTEGVVRWAIEIMDNSSTSVRTLQGNGAPPQSVRFDGNNDLGEALPDGLYRGRLSVAYQSGNIPRADSAAFEIDRVAPFAQTAKEWSIISPDGNGENDTMLIYQETSTEERWTGEIRNASGALVYSTIWEGQADFRWNWDALDTQTSLVPDGEYSYILRATDPAGNEFATEPVRFTVDTSSSEYLLALNYRAFSPNADQVRDFLEIRISQQRDATVRSYELRIEDRSGSLVRSFAGSGTIPALLRWDGKRQNGTPVPDGAYTVGLFVQHTSGSDFESQQLPVIVDTTFPSLTANVSEPIFSPNNDGSKDTITLTGTSSVEDSIAAEIIDSENQVVFSRSFSGRVSPILWDGRDSIGNISADGNYVFRLSSTDQAGNSRSAVSDVFTLDTRQANAFVTLGSRGIAPTGNGLFDTMEFGLYLNLLEGLESWQLSIQNDENTTVRTFRGNDASESFTLIWDGRTSSGNIVPGTYRAIFEARYTKGDAPQATSARFVLDTSGPALRVSAAPVPFSPDGDGVADEVRFAIDAQDQSAIAAWNLQIFDRTNKLFQEFGGQGAPPQRIVWDGLSGAGERVIAAEDYPYRLTAIDSLGNQNSVEGVVPTDIFVIRDGDKLYIQIAAISFEPNSPNLVLDGNNPLGVRNSLILDRLVQLFDRYPSYRIRIEGHAVNVTGTEREQVQELIPLAEQRSSSVRNALVARGMDAGRISIVGIGGARPLVPHSDLENRWKNRRVEFILER